MAASHTGTEHLLLALALGDDAVAQVLAAAGAPAATLRATLAFVFGPTAAPDGAVAEPLPHSPRVERVVAQARHAAIRRRAEVTPAHLLVALLAEGGRAVAVLDLLGLSPQRLRQRLGADAASALAAIDAIDAIDAEADPELEPELEPEPEPDPEPDREIGVEVDDA